MRRRAMFLWTIFGVVILLVLAACVVSVWFILGPYGPPLPWRQTPAATAATPPRPTATTTTRPKPTATTANEPKPTATNTPVIRRPTSAPTTALESPAPTPPEIIPTPAPTIPPPSSQAPYPGNTPPPTNPPIPPTASTPTTSPTPVAGDGTETARRLAEAAPEPRDLVAITSRLLYNGAALPRTVTPDPRPYTVGRQDHFTLSDPGLSASREITATLLVVTDHLYMYVENGVQVDQQAVEDAASIFEEEIYPTTRAAFGSEWSPGVDGDPHIVILNAVFADAAGYFSSLNEVPRTVNPHSNQHEMFCMNTDGMEIGDIDYLSTLAHEFQHMIHWSIDPLGEAWVNEGMAQMSEQINGYDPSGWVWSFLTNPDLQLTTWALNSQESHAHYGSSYLWFRYFTDRLGSTTVLGSILDPHTDEMVSIEQVLQLAGYGPAVSAPRLFDAFFSDWAVANYINDASVGDGRYAYAADFALDTLYPGETLYSLPWITTTTVHPYATDYIAVETFQEAPLHIAFDGSETLPLVATTPHSGKYFWYSNRGDLSDMTLTRAVDLRGVSQATLRYWLWYDIEDDYDYAYLEVSTDAGRSWTTLPGRYTTDTNPNGNSFGHGYTGKSGNGDTPVWVQEQIDLGAYAGREVLIRLEYITDDCCNAPGLALDGLEIPEIGLADDMESDQGWNAQGFVWIDNTVPLRFLVQIVTKSATGKITVQQLTLDAAQRGELTIPDYDQDTAVTLVISAVAPTTTEPATYQVQITQE